MTATANLSQPSSAQLRALVLMQCAVLAPLLLALPWLLLPILISVAAFRLSRRRDYRPPNMLMLTLIAASGLALVLLSSAAYNLVETMFAVLSLSFILKLLEVRSLRDTSTLMLLGFILIAANLIFHPSLLATIYALVCIIFLLALWRSLGSAAATSNTAHTTHPDDNHLRWSLLLIFKALPVFLFLFLLMPRINPLWNLPTPTQNQTGFSDVLDLTEISELAQDTSTAFRVNFFSELPEYAQLYWVGRYLSHFDGRVWHPHVQEADLTLGTRAPPLPDSPESLAAANARAHSYSILLEPHMRTALFRLGEVIGATSAQQTLYLNSEGNLTLREPLSKRVHYTLRTQDTSAAPQLPQTQHMSYLQLPPEGNPQARALAAKWLQEGETPEAVIDKALAFYRDGFTYSLRPPRLNGDTVDAFLFESRVGFCGHYASSLTFLLRAALIPARVVSGYMGGSFNPIESYLRVQQSDAHAWVEVWLDDQGWVRIDPTAVVAPERLTTAPELRDASLDNLPRNSLFAQGSFMQRLEMQWDAIDYAWQKFITEFSGADYLARLSRGLGLYQGLVTSAVIALLIVCSALLTLGPGRYLRRRFNRSPEQQAADLLTRLQQRLVRKGLRSFNGQTPGHWLHALAARNPDQAEVIVQIAKASDAVLYANQPDALRTLRHALARLQIKQLI